MSDVLTRRLREAASGEASPHIATLLRDAAAECDRLEAALRAIYDDKLTLLDGDIGAYVRLQGIAWAALSPAPEGQP